MEKIEKTFFEKVSAGLRGERCEDDLVTGTVLGIKVIRHLIKFVFDREEVKKSHRRVFVPKADGGYEPAKYVDEHQVDATHETRSFYWEPQEPVHQLIQKVYGPHGFGEYEAQMMFGMTYGDPMQIICYKAMDLGQKSQNVYVFNKGFWKAYRRLPIDDLKCRDFFKLGEAGHIILPDPIIDDDGDPITKIWFGCERVENANRIWIGYLCDGRPTLGGLNHFFTDDEFDKSYFDTDWFGKDESTAVLKKDRSAYLNILSAIAYVISGEPDITFLKQSQKGRNSVRNRKRASKIRNLSAIPLKMVGFSWMKQRQTFVDEWEVEPYLARRWYGEGRLKWKVVLVQGSVRSRKK